MLQRFKRLFARKAAAHTGAPCRIPAHRHQLSPADISPGAREVVAKLRAAGHQALVVGGCVRDTLLGKQAKDFDVATDATPEQVRALFRRARIIGRRFQIVHVHQGRELVEVTTFRAGHERHDQPSARGERAHRNPRGILVRDNVFGSLEEDAQRRDFTINALYYDPATDELLDFVGGLADMAGRTLRIIGDPATRFREDPVRMLRAARFHAKLGFALHPATAAALSQSRRLLAEVPPARLFDEVVKLLMTGHGLAAYDALRTHGLLEYLLPDTATAAADPRWDRFLRQALSNTDERIAHQQRVTPGFLFAALLWPPVAIAASRDPSAPPTVAALHQAGSEVLSRVVHRLAIPRRFSTPAREIWELQPHLERPGKRSAGQLVSHPRFRAAYDFLLLREQSGEDLGGSGAWWTRFQEAAQPEREAMLDALQAAPRRRRRPRRRAQTAGTE
ncbi:MAG: polynucleotide adenylyltransferase PcnB [Pseudomonadota bacterium]